MTARGVRLAGTFCPCGEGDLQIVMVGTEPIKTAGVMLDRGVPNRGWCCPEHATIDGWPFLVGEKQTRRRTKVRAPEAGPVAGDVPGLLLDVSSLNSARLAEAPAAPLFGVEA